MNDYNSFDENWCYAKALKREGAEYDGQVVSVKENAIIRCCRCRKASTPLYSKKYGTFLHKQFYCQDCNSNIGQCFICRVMFESTKNLNGIDKTQIECKDCLKTPEKK